MCVCVCLVGVSSVLVHLLLYTRGSFNVLCVSSCCVGVGGEGGGELVLTSRFHLTAFALKYLRLMTD